MHNGSLHMASLILCAVLTTPAVHGEEVHSLPVPSCSTAPRLDARLDDEAWTEAHKHSGFFLYGPENPTAAKVETTVWLCRDDAWLYIAFRCEEPDCLNIQKADRARDGSLHFDDSVEVFIDPGTDGRAYAHFTLSAANARADQWVDGERKDRHWDLAWRSAAAVDPHLDTATGWSCELAVPLYPLSRRGGRGTWRINLTRNRPSAAPRHHATLAWLPKGAGFHAPRQFLPLEAMEELTFRPAFGPMIKKITVAPLELLDQGYSYTLTVKVANTSGRGGTLDVAAQDHPRGNTGRLVSHSIALGPIDTKTVDLRVPIENPGPRTAWVGTRESGTDLWLQKLTVSDMERVSPFQCYLDRSYYTMESRARVVVELNVPRTKRLAEELRLTARLVGPNGSPYAATETPAYDNVVRAALDLRKAPVATNRVVVTLRNKDEANLGRFTLGLVKRPPAPQGVHEVKIDHDNRCLLLDGAPFLPIGAFGMWWHGKLEGPTHELIDAQYGYAKEAGLNTLIDWNGFLPPWEDFSDLRKNYDLMREHGLYTIARTYKSGRGEYNLHYGSPEFRDNALKVIDRMGPVVSWCASHPAVLMYYHLDEPAPYLRIDDLLIAFKDRVHALDPYHPVYMSLCSANIWAAGPVWFGTVADLLGEHDYFYPGDALAFNSLAPRFHALNFWCKKARVPTMQATILEWHGISTREERIAMNYLAAIHGAKSLMFFAMPFKHRETVEGQAEASRQLQKLAPALLKRRPEQVLTFSPETAISRYDYAPNLYTNRFPMVQAAVNDDPDGTQVLLAVNAARKPVSVRFSVNSLQGSSRIREIFGSQRTLPVKDNGFEDAFEPLEAKAYRIETPVYDRNAPVDIHVAMSGPAVTGVSEPQAPELLKTGTNLLINAGFERETEGWNGVNHGAELDEERPKSGTRCLRVAGTAERRAHSVISRPFFLKPGTRYRFGGWIRRDVTQMPYTPRVMLHSAKKLEDGTWPIKGSAELRPTQGEAWTDVSGEVTTPEADVQWPIWFYAWVHPDTLGHVWFDDLFCTEVLETAQEPAPTGPKNLLMNSGFERAEVEGKAVNWHGPMWKYLMPDPRASGMDTEEPYQGKVCFRLTKPQGVMSGTSGAFLSSEGVAIQPETLYTFSAYVRTDRPGRRARIYDRGEWHYLDLDTTWRRFSRTFLTRKGQRYFYARIYLSDWSHEPAFNVYVDAAQLEIGSEVTDYEHRE